ncbi:MAG TPA: formylglycine-generating enzyme family protein [Gaiellaceae bacterium]|nr:formylglycine-generating enzyme family protein [Gaiellaceae bacterium]
MQPRVPPVRTDDVVLPGGKFTLGDDRGEGHPADREGPARTVSVASFAIGATAVTNEEFAAFAADTGYVTDAERLGWSFVFAGLVRGEAARDVRGHVAGADWWLGVDGACWRRPFGAGSDLDGLADHPVVHVSWHDAERYCAWAGGRLPGEAEWEYASRGGLEGKRYPWGDELRPDGRWRCNIWQGRFPVENTCEDGWAATAPARAFEPNGFGLYQAVGNVWEWCGDPFGDDEETRAIRGGSYLCHDSYCNRYRVAARSGNTRESSGGNLGFRLARDV